MATVTLTGNSNLSSLTFASGDTIQTAQFTLTIDQSATVNIATNNAAGRVLVAAGTFAITGNLSTSIAPSASWFTVATGQSLTINGVMTTWTTSTPYCFAVTGGTLVLNAGSSSAVWCTSGVAQYPMLLQSGGTVTLTGQLSLGLLNNGAPIAVSAGAFTQTGNNTITGSGGTALALASGSGSVTLTGNTTSTAGMTVPLIQSIGASSSVSLNGAFSQVGAAGSNPAVAYCGAVGSSITVSGSLKSGSGAISLNMTIGGTVNWTNQTVVVGAAEEVVCLVQAGTLNIQGLILTNSGKVAVAKFASGVLTVNGTTAVNNQTSTAQAAVIGATVSVTNQPSTVSYIPTSGQVQNGVVFGYVGSTLTGTAATIDYTAMSTAMVSALNASTPSTAPTAGTIGAIFTYLGAKVGRIGTAQAGGTKTITLDVGASTVDNRYRGYWGKILAGTGSGQTFTILSYVGSTLVATIGRNGDTAIGWDIVPDNTSVFLIEPMGMSDVGMISGTTQTGATIGGASPTAVQIATQVWQDLLSSADFSTAGSVGALLKANVDATISTRMQGSSYVAPPTLAQILAGLLVDGGNNKLKVNPDHSVNATVLGSGGTGVATVTITVTDGTNPIQSAKVQLTINASVYSATTNSSGVVVLNPNEGAGTYGLHIAAGGFDGLTTTLIVNPTTTTPSAYALTPNTITPSTGDGVTGWAYTTDATGKNTLANTPVQFAMVALPPGSTGTIVKSSPLTVTSDGNGLLQIENLTPQSKYEYWISSTGVKGTFTAENATFPINGGIV